MITNRIKKLYKFNKFTFASNGVGLNCFLNKFEHTYRQPCIEWGKNNQIISKEYYHFNKSHKINRPWKILFIKYDNSVYNHYKIYDITHKINGPAVIEYNKNTYSLNFHSFQKIRRKYGPVIIEWHKGTSCKVTYYVKEETCVGATLRRMVTRLNK